MSKLDFLIPPGILSLIDEDKLELAISLSATSARGVWPRARIWLDDVIIDDQQINKHATINYKLPKKLKDTVILKIEYLDKTSDHTVVDESGQIIENQSLNIDSLFINNVDVVKTQIIYKLGVYTRILSESTLQYFRDHGIDYGPSHSLTMTENGSWDINLTFPVTKQIIELTAIRKKHELWLDDDILSEINDTINQIRNAQ